MVTWDAFAQADYNAFGPNLETRIRGKFSEKNITQRNERTDRIINDKPSQCSFPSLKGVPLLYDFLSQKDAGPAAPRPPFPLFHSSPEPKDAQVCAEVFIFGRWIIYPLVGEMLGICL
jgi:hypothetical protein